MLSESLKYDSSTLCASSSWLRLAGDSHVSGACAACVLALCLLWRWCSSTSLSLSPHEICALYLSHSTDSSLALSSLNVATFEMPFSAKRSSMWARLNCLSISDSELGCAMSR